MKELGVAIVGLGFMGETFSEAISKHCKNAKLKVVCDLDESRSKQTAKAYDVEYTTSYEQLLEREDVSVIFLETPHCAHYDQAIAAIKASKHVMIEKPMARTVDECDEIIAFAKKNNVLCSISFTQRSRNCNIKTKSLLDSQQYGKIHHILHYQMEGCHSIGDYPGWQNTKENIGLTFGHAVHSFDFMRWLTGAEISSVYARITNIEPEYEVDGTAMALVTMSNGTVASIYFSGQVKKPLFPNHIFCSEIVCEKGLIDSESYARTKTNISGEWETVEVQKPVPMPFRDNRFSMIRMESYTRHCQGFFDAIIEGKQPPITDWDGRQAVAAALAAYESSKSGKVVNLNS